MATYAGLASDPRATRRRAYSWIAGAALAAGVWVGSPPAIDEEDLKSIGRWSSAVASLLFAAIYATLWEHAPPLRTSAIGRAGAVLLMVAWPAYSVGALLATVGVRAGRANARTSLDALAPLDPAPATVPAGTAVAALVGGALGVAWAGVRLIPRLPAGYVLVGAALVLALVGVVEARRSIHAERNGPMRGKAAIVTGVGARGQVGYAVAEALLRAGASVLVTGRSAELETLAHELAQHGNVLAMRADLTDGGGAQAVVAAAGEHLGRVDVLVNVAGGLSVIKPLAETADDEWTREIDRNARTTFLMCRAALPLLRQSRGAIINFASPAGVRAKASLGAYSAAKAAVVALTRALALEEARNGVRVNAIAPGMIDTAQNVESARDPSAVRWVTRQQIADVVLFLAGDTASGISGETIHVLGGAQE